MSLVGIYADIPNIDGVLRAVEKAGRGELPNTKEAIQSATRDVIQRTWIAYASGTTVTYSGGTFRINVVSGAYIRSIQDGLRFPEDLTGEVVTTSPHGAIIERGITPFDMKKGLLSSPKAKVGKDGKKFITVGFRHGTPNTVGLQPMPNAVYNQVKNFTYSRRNNALVSFFTGQKYKWGDRYGSDPTGQRSHTAPAQRAGYTWKTGQYSGMVRMGSPKHSQYMTFRRVSENSDPRSWQHGGKPPRKIRDAVVENTRDEVLALVRTGFEMDLYFMGLGGE